MFRLPPLETHYQLSPECLVLGVWFCKFPRAEESPWDPAFPGTVLTWDTLLETAKTDLGKKEAPAGQGNQSWQAFP